MGLSPMTLSPMGHSPMGHRRGTIALTTGKTALSGRATAIAVAQRP
jgi:hypothetical protein